MAIHSLNFSLNFEVNSTDLTNDQMFNTSFPTLKRCWERLLDEISSIGDQCQLAGLYLLQCNTSCCEKAPVHNS